MRRKRYIRAGKVYSLTFRVRQGLPFVCNKIVNLLIESAIARSQRDNKVSLCHDLWMTNHAHLISVFYDMNQATKFYMEIKKKVTDYYKRLLGLKKLNLWEEDDSVCEILDLEAAMKQIAYLYANPANANLVSSIDEYPGVSSWEAFYTNKDNSLKATAEKDIPWIRQPSIKAIRGKKITRAQDSHYYNKLVSSSRFKHKLTRETNAWMAAFGVTDAEEIKAINEEILSLIREFEQISRDRRIEKNQTPMGAYRLVNQEITVTGYKPKKNNDRIFVISSDKELRINYIKEVKFLFDYCKELYKQACLGVRVVWPPGVFPASYTPLCSALT